ncbi:DapH/DapD/GlmU-related protein [Phenylobacterium ferrooxidans]|uniref:Chloramphenicol acetyltransferase n=1 Tax=Phenylobacterium ferrooxidans TaxID=2982689 RepID=A0ABW6CJB3_9CAUL
MRLRLADRPLEDGYLYFDRYVQQEPAEARDSAAPVVHKDAQVHDSILGPWTRVGARTSFSEVSMGAYSYIVNDASANYAEIGKFCSIARDARLNPGNHPTWKAALHHFTYRTRSYELGPEDDHDFFEWRRSHTVTLGHDVWIGHGATVLPGVSIGTGSVVGAGAVVSKDVPPFTIVGGVPSKPIRERFPKAVQDGLLAVSWWDWSHERLADAIDDFRDLDADAFVEKYA